MIANVLASVGVKNLDAAIAWYSRLLERAPDSRPMPEVAEWSFPRGGWLQVYHATDQRAGNGSCTFAVDDINALADHAAAMGVDVSDRSDGARVRTLMIADLEGNHLAFAEAHDPALAK